MLKIDLNSDLGEGFGAYRMGADHAVLELVSSVNIACGFHAGDPLIMEHSVSAAKAAHAAIGAHPAFPDLAGFGRREMRCSPAEVKAYIKYQLGALSAFTRAAGVSLQHCKVHGALEAMAAKDLVLSLAIAEAVASVDPDIILLAPAGSKLEEAGKYLALTTGAVFFADRAYREDGSPVPLGIPGALIEDAKAAAERTLRLLQAGKLRSLSGEDISLRADSVCIHSPDRAEEFLRAIREALTAAGVAITPLPELLR